MLLSIFILSACGPEPLDEEVAKKAILESFEKQNPDRSKGGRLSYELQGKGQWFEGGDFNLTCLQEKSLAYQHHGKAAQIAPSHEAQAYIGDSTATGFCIDMGEGLKLDIGAVEKSDARLKAQFYSYTVTLSMNAPTPWFECLSESFRIREVLVQYDKGILSIPKEPVLQLRPKDACQHPGTAFQERPERARAEEKPKRSPDRKTVIKLLEKFDQALYDGKFDEALQLVSCVDLYQSKWGHCAVSELVPLGPSSKGSPRMQDGTPWLMNRLKDFSKIKSIMRDGKDPTLYHVRFQDRKTKKDRSFSVQYDGGAWKLLGAVSEYQQGLTPLSFILDLHNKKTRDIFKRRLAGEKIDHRGRPLDPMAEEEEKK
ncbi:MAG: hypothetical protein VX278_17040 [Myxococcota bacterium]|nr:hypothetical protein [Myxococcota bacterium]